MTKPAHRPATNAEPKLHALYSTIREDDIARAVEATYSVGRVETCHLIRRGFNDVYALRSRGGGRYVARLADLRARGGSNVAFETTFLDHLKAAGSAVGAPVRCGNGALWRELEAPEGHRVLTVFEHLDGDLPRGVLTDIAVMGAGLADIHNAGERYAGPSSVYRLDFEHLCASPLARLLAAPTVEPDLAERLTAAADALEARVRPLKLAQVTCHGDCHGGNTFMTDAPDGERRAAFFDFDDAGPGYLAYDLAVYLWSHLLGKALAAPDADLLERWTHYIEGYRRRRAIPDVDYEAIAMFVSIRHFWLMGEYASRIPEWGTEALSTAWLRRQAKLLDDWATLATPAV